jgi:hypothetical protein
MSVSATAIPSFLVLWIASPALAMTALIPYHPCIIPSCLEIPAIPRHFVPLPFSSFPRPSLDHTHKEKQ